MSVTRTPVPALEVVEQPDRLTVRFPAHTSLTGENIEEVGRRLAGLVAGRDRPHLWLDLSTVDFLTSAVLARFISLNGKVRAAGGRLTLTAPRPDVRRVFAVTKLDRVFDIRDGAESLPA